jgi:hypothetical protein
VSGLDQNGEMLLASDVVNAIPDIEKKSYLELGVASRVTFDAVKAGTKVGVDMLGGDGILMMTTDDFFLGKGVADDLDPFYDVIYIDADHSLLQVVEDYNNSVTRLRPGGLILMHDMYPPNEYYAQEIYCGDAFKFLPALYAGNPGNVHVLDHNFGLTLVQNARTTVLKMHDKEMTHASFLKMQIPTVTRAEMLGVLA